MYSKLNPNNVLRHIILAVSSLAMLLGILVMLKVLVPRYFPGEFGFIMGLLVFLYGAYRFVVVFFQKRNAERDEERE